MTSAPLGKQAAPKRQGKRNARAENVALRLPSLAPGCIWLSRSQWRMRKPHRSGGVLWWRVRSRREPLADLSQMFFIKAIAFDQYRIKYLEPELEEASVSVPLIPHGQGYYKAQESGLWMPHSIELFEQMLDDGAVVIKTNPCLRWNAASAVTEADQKENRIFAKKKSTGRIDGVVASAMAIGASEEDVTDDGDVDGFFDDPIIVGTSESG